MGKILTDRAVHILIHTLDDNREDLAAPEVIHCVRRGGAFFNFLGFVRCAYRYRNLPNDSYSHVGVRVVVHPAS
jgi:formylglycine-generating enzyme required for sulfatase activity